MKSFKQHNGLHVFNFIWNRWNFPLVCSHFLTRSVEQSYGLCKINPSSYVDIISNSLDVFHRTIKQRQPSITYVFLNTFMSCWWWRHTFYCLFKSLNSLNDLDGFSFFTLFIAVIFRSSCLFFSLSYVNYFINLLFQLLLYLSFEYRCYPRNVSRIIRYVLPTFSLSNRFIY